ncbi:hypothetical protein LCGC14_3027800, partial [marine sediment metagenome]
NDAGRRPPELLTRDIVAKAILAETKAGRGSPQGGAFLDIASVRDPEYIKKKLPSMYHQFKTLANLDITKDPMEVGPTTHYIMGGIRVDPDTQQATISGLYAAGEVAAGLHGANRLGGNSLTDLLVFGKLAGENAAKYAKEINNQLKLSETDVKKAIGHALAPFSEDRTEDVYQLHTELQRLMEEHVGIIRNETAIKAGIEKLEALSERAKKAKASGNRVYNPGWHLSIDINNLILTSKALAIAALERKESRGAHTRDDYAETDSSLTDKLQVLNKDESGKLILKQEIITPMPEELKKIIEEGT